MRRLSRQRKMVGVFAVMPSILHQLRLVAVEKILWGIGRKVFVLNPTTIDPEAVFGGILVIFHLLPGEGFGCLLVVKLQEVESL